MNSAIARSSLPDTSRYLEEHTQVIPNVSYSSSTYTPRNLPHPDRPSQSLYTRIRPSGRLISQTLPGRAGSASFPAARPHHPYLCPSHIAASCVRHRGTDCRPPERQPVSSPTDGYYNERGLCLDSLSIITTCSSSSRPSPTMMVATPLASGANTTFLPSTTTQPSPPQSYTPGSRAMPQTPPSADVSPTNLYPHLHVRQLRPPKQPLYTPACLRPTEPLTKPKDIPDRPRAPDTPPQSKESSFDSGASHPVKGSTDRVPIVTPPIVGGADSSERDLGAAESRALDQDVGYVTGYPTIAHWKVSQTCRVWDRAWVWEKIARL